MRKKKFLTVRIIVLAPEYEKNYNRLEDVQRIVQITKNTRTPMSLKDMDIQLLSNSSQILVGPSLIKAGVSYNINTFLPLEF